MGYPQIIDWHAYECARLVVHFSVRPDEWLGHSYDPRMVLCLVLPFRTTCGFELTVCPIDIYISTVTTGPHW